MGSWYDDWAERHVMTFGLNGESDLATVLAWEPIFAAADYTAEDLNDATSYLASRPDKLAESPMRFQSKLAVHLHAIHARIRDRRAVPYAPVGQVDRHGEEVGTCTTCGGTGWVEVPHPASVHDGRWEPMTSGTGNGYVTAAVTCSCALGRWCHNRLEGNDKIKAPMSLDSYQKRNQRWEAQLRGRRQAQAMTARAYATPHGRLDQVMATLAEKFALPREEAF